MTDTNKTNRKQKDFEHPSGTYVDFVTFMYGLINADYERTNCKECYGLGAVPDMCCTGFDCGCHGMPVDFQLCDCGIDFPSDEQINKWADKSNWVA